ncbi:Predicted amidohydrolase [Desulfonispora thiosulfatigenes DSM 11270]|uniref:Predicted amidohydrolase n=1 Tax=Desulfonispora thiosulfatigenes DSM 11270 TaxID=656914 RepID=A0A1W1VCP9_DESTI|nr:carbon-nitrogen hydrolase family protein [Desulfonispora thiosulfatigenes]SMB91096.1 Predicted amidohydrolase [Desulfonispora thiosulfatigenes DSM 11270]
MELKIGLIQMKTVDSKEENLMKAEKMIKEAVGKGANFIVLPEMFNCPYETSNFIHYAEEERGRTWGFLAKIAKENNIYLVGGSIPEIEGDKTYNTSYVFNNTGAQIAKHRKIHLFDIDVVGGQKFKESDTLTSGNDLAIFVTPFGKMAVIICYDLRFPELSRLLVQKGVKLIIVPASFNMTTGPLHWELLFRARAVDNQVYMIGAAGARNYDSSYIGYGNSLIVDPFGKITDKLTEREEILVTEIDIAQVEAIRNQIPVLKHLRHDLYELIYKK